VLLVCSVLAVRLAVTCYEPVPVFFAMLPVTSHIVDANMIKLLSMLNAGSAKNIDNEPCLGRV
jgi:hypothetical protein